MNVNLDRIHELSEEEQQQFFRRAQKYLKRTWAEIRNKIEKEIDLERKTE